MTNATLVTSNEYDGIIFLNSLAGDSVSKLYMIKNNGLITNTLLIVDSFKYKSDC